MPKVKGGAIQVARKTINSELWETKPSWWFKIWLYLLLKAAHSDNGQFQRGQLHTSYSRIFQDCNLSNENIRPKSVENAIRWLKRTTQITTHKTTRGLIVTICNYGKYQDLNNYRNDKQNDTPNATRTTQNRHYKQECINNGYKVGSDEYRLAAILLTEIQKNKLDFKKPNLQSWARDIGLMIRKDSRKPEIWDRGQRRPLPLET